MGQITEDITFSGNCRFIYQPTFPDGGVNNAKVAAAAAIAYTKLQHLYNKTVAQSGSAASATYIIHNVYGATGTVVEFSAESVVLAIGAATVTVDLQKNGVSMLTGVITLDTGNTAYVKELAGFSSTAVVAGDTLTVVIVATASSGTLPTGLGVNLVIAEDAA